MSLPKLLTPEETGKALGVNSDTLALWRRTNRYWLRYEKAGGRAYYLEEDVINLKAFLAEKKKIQSQRSLRRSL